MMATTHVLAGVALAAGASLLGAEVSVVVVLAAGVGGLVPDLDLYAGHRRTLHYPVVLPVLAAVALGIATVIPRPGVLVVAFFLAGAALHAAMDVLGGGLELKPWEATSERAVYDHVRGQWIAPRRWIPYDGSPQDLGLAVLLGIPAFLAVPAPIDPLVIGLLAVSAVYAILRKPMVHATEHVLPRLPSALLGYVPDRFLEAATD